MFGRSASLLVISLLLLPLSLSSQSDRNNPAAHTALDLSTGFHARLPQVVAPFRLPTPIPPRFPVAAPGGFGFPQFARAAGRIFSGTVTNVERRPAGAGQAVESVAITLHVENAIRGVTPGENLTISQWIGLWSSGQRYRVGERVLLFLYPDSKLGLTSCVGGPMGRLTFDRWGRILLTAQHISAFRADPVLGGKSRVAFSDFTLAVRRAGEEE